MDTQYRGKSTPTKNSELDLPKVSAIIATYNRGYVVCDAIESILHQTYPEIEVIVVDDGSTDDTQEKLKRYGNSVKVLYQRNQGPAAAWNSGISAARGSIICFLGSDDLWLPTFVSTHVSLLQRGGPKVPCSISNAMLRFTDGVEADSFKFARLSPEGYEGLWTNPLDVLLTRFVMCGQTLAIRREALEKIGNFDPSLRYLEDYDIALRLALEGPWCYALEPLVVYRQSADSMSLNAPRIKDELSGYTLRIRQRIGREMKSRYPSLRSRYLARAIRRARVDVNVARFESSQGVLGICIARAYRVLQHYLEAFYRRTPLYPRMKVVPLAGSGHADAAPAYTD